MNIFENVLIPYSLKSNRVKLRTVDRLIDNKIIFTCSPNFQLKTDLKWKNSALQTQKTPTHLSLKLFGLMNIKYFLQWHH